MTSGNSKPTYTLFTGLLMLSLACLSFFSLCNWVMSGCLESGFIKQAGLAALLLTIGLFAIAWQIWRTSRYTRQLMNHAYLPLPPHVEALVAEFGPDVSQVTLIQSSKPIAFCFGFLRPRICLSTGLVELLSVPQLRAALLHEDYHRQHFDPLRILMIEALGAALFFLPVVQEWRMLYKIKLELDADSYAVARVGKATLAGALHRLLSFSPGSAAASGVVTAGLSANSARIAALLGERSTPQQISPRSFLISALILWVLCLLLML